MSVTATIKTSNIPYKRSLELILKLCIFLLLSWTIYKQVFHNEDITGIRNKLTDISITHWWMIVVVLVMMLINWCLEALKWHLLINRVEKISYRKSALSIFAGNAFTLFTPNRIGEYAGRLVFLNRPMQTEPFLATFLGSISQIVVTLVVGLLGLLFISAERLPLDGGAIQLIYVVTGLTALVILLVYFNFEKIYAVIFKRLPQKYRQYFKSLLHYSKGELALCLWIAFLRYVVYSFQFWLLLYFFGVAVNGFLDLAEIAAVFLLQTIIPSISILELGIRGNIALMIFSGYDGLGVVSASFTLWFINLVIPAVIGYLVILGRRIILS